MESPLHLDSDLGPLGPWFSLALWLAGAACFCVLGAGVQVPLRLNWREELPRLSAFNRKLVRVYFAFIGATIAGFGAMTFALHDEMLRGDRAALWLAGFIGLWWSARIAIDAAYFDHRDWPKGRAFLFGHALLTTTFIAMAATYLGLVVWHLM